MTEISRRDFLSKATKSAVLIGLSGLLPVYSMNSDKRPNILFIMADDHDANLVGCYNSWLKKYVSTPNIDRISKEGARMNNCFCSNSLCAPSRATIVTGMYSHKSGVYTLREELNTDISNVQTSQSTLSRAGYQTAVVGKWHIHGNNLSDFDYYAVTHKSQGRYMNPHLETSKGKMNYEGHSSKVYTDISLNWLEDRDSEKPFFLMHHFKAAHGPWQFDDKYKELYENQEIPEPPTLWDNYKNRNPNGVKTKTSRIHQKDSKSSLSLWFQKNKNGKGTKEWPTGKLNTESLSDREAKKATYQKYVKDYMRCVKGIDDNIGRILDYLKKEKILDNTVVIYTSDQGMYVGEHGFFDKRLGLDEGMRMPFVIQYPKEIKKQTVLDDMISNVDFAQTIIDYAETESPKTMQGISFRKILKGENPKEKRDAAFYAFYSNGVNKHYGLRTRNYKLLKYVGKNDNVVIGSDLFDMKKDPHELKSVINDKNYQSVLELMETKLKEEMKKIDISSDKLPGSSSLKTGTNAKKSKVKKKKNKRT